MIGDPLDGGWAVYLWLFAAGTLMTEPWRWLGVWLSRDIDIQSELFKWAKAVSTALVAGLVSRMVLFPSGALETLPLWLRVIAFVVGILAYFAFGRVLARGVIAAIAVLLAGATIG